MQWGRKWVKEKLFKLYFMNCQSQQGGNDSPPFNSSRLIPVYIWNTLAGKLLGVLCLLTDEP